MTVKIMLKKIRTERGLSQNQLARLADTSLQNIQKIEYGKTKGIQYEMLNRLCQILQCRPGDLLEWVPDDNCDRQTQPPDSSYSSESTGDNVIDGTSDRQSRSHLKVVPVPQTLESA